MSFKQRPSPKPARGVQIPRRLFLNRSLHYTTPISAALQGALARYWCHLRGRCKSQSFPRKRESTPQAFGSALSRNWIPAFAGMTGILEAIPSQVRPTAVVRVEYVYSDCLSGMSRLELFKRRCPGLCPESIVGAKRFGVRQLAAAFASRACSNLRRSADL